MSDARSKRFVEKQRRAAARRVAGQLLPRASKAERREEKRARRIRRTADRFAAEVEEATRRRFAAALAESPLVRGEGDGEPVGIASDAAPTKRATRPNAHRTLVMIAAVAALGGRP